MLFCPISDYVRALQQAFEQQQQSARAAAAAGTDGGALYRQYANAGMPGAILQQPMLVRSAMQHQSIPQHGQNQPPHTSSAQVMTSSAQPSDGSQRVSALCRICSFSSFNNAPPPPVITVARGDRSKF